MRKMAEARTVNAKANRASAMVKGSKDKDNGMAKVNSKHKGKARGVDRDRGSSRPKLRVKANNQGKAKVSNQAEVKARASSQGRGKVKASKSPRVRVKDVAKEPNPAVDKARRNPVKTREVAKAQDVSPVQAVDRISTRIKPPSGSGGPAEETWSPAARECTAHSIHSPEMITGNGSTNCATCSR